MRILSLNMIQKITKRTKYTARNFSGTPTNIKRNSNGDDDFVPFLVMSILIYGTFNKK